MIMTEIIPAILEKEWKEIENKINLVKAFIASEIGGWVQLDITDGIFVLEKSWNNHFDLKSYLSHLEAKLPSVGISVEIDLMVKSPELVIKDWADAGARRVIIHIESTDNAGKAIAIAREAGIEVGLALNIDTPNEVLDEFISKIDFVQFMGIANIGFQGQLFDNKVLHKIEDLRMKYPNAIITIDGGVSIETAPVLVKAGANRLATGSAIFSGTQEPFENWEKLKDLTASLRN